MEVFAGGACALVQWRLETGRTHQVIEHSNRLVGVKTFQDLCIYVNYKLALIVGIIYMDNLLLSNGI